LDTFSIEKRFHGPPASGNGGYTCGRLAQYIDGPAKVRLRVPPALDRELRVERDDTGRVRLLDDTTLVAEAWRATVDLIIPPAPSFEVAQSAGERFRGFRDHFYPSCFVCGPEREAGDGLRVFAGPLRPGETTREPETSTDAACIWDAAASYSGVEFLPPEIIWAALDCPGAFAFPDPENASVLLGELTAHLFEPAPGNARYALLAWEIAHEGRKHHTGTALYSESGLCHGIARATWIEVPAAR
jgi:hypothetical protein